MSDSYLNFATSPWGGKLTDTLGLPKPLVLERYEAGQPVVRGSILVGGTTDSALLPALAQIFKSMGAHTLAHRQ